MIAADKPATAKPAARKKERPPPSPEQLVKAAEYTKLRKQRGTKEEVAEALGVNRSTLVRREFGEIDIPQEAFLALMTLPVLEAGPASR